MRSTFPAFYVHLMVLMLTGGVQMERSDYTYYKLDHPDVLRFVFHPRKDFTTALPAGAMDYAIAVNGDVSIGCRFYLAGRDSPSIIFFHGNGEVVSDYDDIGPIYNRYGISLLAVDYRGYGRSSGAPTVTSMMQDAHDIFKEITRWLKDQGRTGPLFVMGRSLGSASALEIASTCGSDISGLIIESGFAYTAPLLNFLGVDTRAYGINETDCLMHIEKIKHCTKSTLIIHAEFDQFIPMSDAEALFNTSPAQKKELKKISGADHNTILMMAGKDYFETIKAFITGR